MLLRRGTGTVFLLGWKGEAILFGRYGLALIGNRYGVTCLLGVVCRERLAQGRYGMAFLRGGRRVMLLLLLGRRERRRGTAMAVARRHRRSTAHPAGLRRVDEEQADGGTASRRVSLGAGCKL